MDCPKDGTTLEAGEVRDIAVEKCPQCGGLWLDQPELAQLEATVEPDPDWRAGMVEWGTATSELRCPVCGEPMKSFSYRGDTVRLETCRQQHGYWLDRGEALQVREAMEERVEDLERAQKAEAEWGATIYKSRNPSWWDRLMRFLRG